MDFTLVRVDNRLVHGQILEAWLPYTKASCIIVADDAVASDFLHETVIKMAVPREIEVAIYGIQEFSSSHTYSEKNHKKAIVLYSTIESALKSYQLGFKFEKLNIGNVYSENFSLRCAASIQLSDHDISEIQTLLDLGVSVECRCVPKDKPINMREFLKGRKTVGA